MSNRDVGAFVFERHVVRVVRPALQVEPRLRTLYLRARQLRLRRVTAAVSGEQNGDVDAGKSLEIDVAASLEAARAKLAELQAKLESQQEEKHRAFLELKGVLQDQQRKKNEELKRKQDEDAAAELMAQEEANRDAVSSGLPIPAATFAQARPVGVQSTSSQDRLPQRYLTSRPRMMTPPHPNQDRHSPRGFTARHSGPPIDISRREYISYPAAPSANRSFDRMQDSDRSRYVPAHRGASRPNMRGRGGSRGRADRGRGRYGIANMMAAHYRRSNG